MNPLHRVYILHKQHTRVLLIQLDRGYAIKDEQGRSQTFEPTPLGEALISAYSRMGLTNLWQPQLRGQIEQNISLVAQGARTKEAVLQEAVVAFEGDFASARTQCTILESEVGDIVFGSSANTGGGLTHSSDSHFSGPQTNQAVQRSDQPGSQSLGDCSCGGGRMLLCRDPSGGPPYVQCSSWPLHRFRVDLPRLTTSVTVEEGQRCERCNALLLELGFTRALLPPGFAPRMTACVACDATLKQLLELVGPVARRTTPTTFSHTSNGGAGISGARPNVNQRQPALARGTVMSASTYQTSRRGGRGRGRGTSASAATSQARRGGRGANGWRGRRGGYTSTNR